MFWPWSNSPQGSSPEATQGANGGATKLGPLPLRHLLIGLLVGAGALLLLAVGYIGYCAYTLPLQQNPSAEQGPGAAIYATSAGVPFATRGIYRDEKLKPDRLPPNLVKAVVALEDRRFF